ncbi:MAG: hypothetical protein WA709_20670 [Stellaceae bacterium]
MFPRPHLAVDAGGNQTGGKGRAQQQVIDAQPGVAGKGVILALSPHAARLPWLATSNEFAIPVRSEIGEWEVIVRRNKGAHRRTRPITGGSGTIPHFQNHEVGELRLELLLSARQIGRQILGYAVSEILLLGVT